LPDRPLFTVGHYLRKYIQFQKFHGFLASPHSKPSSLKVCITQSSGFELSTRETLTPPTSMAEYVALQNLENDEVEIAAATSSDINNDTPRWALDPEKQPTSRRTLWKQHLYSALITALPRYIRPGGLRDRDIGPTSYLDALRGYAAFNVFIFHIFGTNNQND